MKRTKFLVKANYTPYTFTSHSFVSYRENLPLESQEQVEGDVDEKFEKKAKRAKKFRSWNIVRDMLTKKQLEGYYMDKRRNVELS